VLASRHEDPGWRDLSRCATIPARSSMETQGANRGNKKLMAGRHHNLTEMSARGGRTGGERVQRGNVN
jgi:hypothetical protein